MFILKLAIVTCAIVERNANLVLGAVVLESLAQN